MGRMEKYEEPNIAALSRTQKNEDLYKDVYLNNTLIDFNKIMDEEDYEIEDEVEEQVEINTIDYVQKDYDINKYLQEKRLLRVKDNLPRSLNDEIKKNDDEITELISKLEQKEKEEDLFNNLLPDDEDTTIIGANNNELSTFVSDDVINNYIMNKELEETNSFMDLEDTKVIMDKQKNSELDFKDIVKRKKSLSLIVFSIITLILIGVIIYVVIKIF